MEINYRKLVFSALRFVGYALLLISLYFIYMYDATHSTAEVKITDSSVTELFQEIFVFIAAVGFFFTGRILKILAPVTNLLALVFLMSFIREMNNIIEFWFYLVLPFIGLFIFLLVKNFKKVLFAFTEFIELKSSGAFFLGFLITYVFSRFFGKKTLWMAMLGDSYTRNAKNLAEEGIELLGYTLIMISVVELLVFAIQKKKESAVNR
jgi:hypothetical protein